MPRGSPARKSENAAQAGPCPGLQLHIEAKNDVAVPIHS